MGRVFVAGSINMDVVATAEPASARSAKPSPARPCIIFPAARARTRRWPPRSSARRPTLIGRLGTDAFGQQLRTFLAAQGVDLAFVKDTAEAHTGTAHHHRRQCRQHHRRRARRQCAGQCRGCRRRRAGQRRRRRQPVRNSASLRSPRSSNGRVRPARPRSSIPRRRSACGPELLELVDILVLNETELGFLAGTALRRYRRRLPASSKPRGRCQSARTRPSA